jgi:hypothetical protein
VNQRVAEVSVTPAAASAPWDSTRKRAHAASRANRSAATANHMAAAWSAASVKRAHATCAHCSAAAKSWRWNSWRARATASHAV